MAYNQVKCDDQTARLLTLNTHKGLYKMNRLPYGVSRAPLLFQRIKDTLLKGLEGVVVLLDDILISGKDQAQLRAREKQVLVRLSEGGLRLKLAKCQFGVTQVQYLGHVISAQGLAPLNDRIAALKAAPAPGNVAQLQAFLGN
ncbi:uncharacterized protein K02A2.6-like [Thrips palmi]|uniref:Uncharacterized protein K02A2.6-like n=1 Tax=Thrips palmi TaxID=161013 RepID=A0A6P8ZUZ3_THRPL|nr:uncharacterized protein K02A2.6-like [Thrips palmi]